MSVKLQCSRCKVLYDVVTEKRFCDECGSFLERHYYEPDEPVEFPLDDEKLLIAEYVYTQYEETRSEYGDLELDLLNQLKVDTPSNRFDAIFLATLFSGWAMREERAYSIWQHVINRFREADSSLYSYLIGLSRSQLDFFSTSYGVPPKIASNIWETAKKLREYNGDLNGLVDENSWRRTLDKIKSNCKGVSQKAFWITRVMRQKGVWDVPGHYCCVSDSHNKAFLMKTGFIKSEADLFYNSKVMWNYFNKPFKNHYYDLPVFRFGRNHYCKKCPSKICNYEKLSQCN